jgi:hypothetical protein
VPQLSRQTDREKINNVPPEVPLHFRNIAKKVLDDFCPKQAPHLSPDVHLSPDGKT